MPFVYSLVLWIHLLVAMFWLGGMIFMVLVVVPVERGISDTKLRFELVSSIGARFKTLGWASIAILVLTGLYNTIIRVSSWDVLFGTRYGLSLLTKLGLVFLMIVLSAYHDFYLGPRVVENVKRGEKRPQDLRLLTLLAKGNLLLGLIVIYIAIILRFGGLNIFH